MTMSRPIEGHPEEATDCPDPALVEPDVPPPLAKLTDVLRGRLLVEGNGARPPARNHFGLDAELVAGTASA
jgi:hypothetical protein